MPLRKPFHITPQGGSIHCLEALSGRIFRACSANQCTYTGDLHSAKSFLDFIENKTIKFLLMSKIKIIFYFKIKHFFYEFLLEVSLL